MVLLGLSCGMWALSLQRTGSVIVAHRLSCSVACRILSDQGSNLSPPHCKVDS